MLKRTFGRKSSSSDCNDEESWMRSHFTWRWVQGTLFPEKGALAADDRKPYSRQALKVELAMKGMQSEDVAVTIHNIGLAHFQVTM